MSWRDRIFFFLVPIPGIGFWLLAFGVLVLAAPFLIPLLLLFLLGLALFKWRPWFGTCYTAVTVALLVWGAAWVQQRSDPLRLRDNLAEKTWTAARKESRIARTIVLKLKTSEFKIPTRSHTPEIPPSSCEEWTSIALTLRSRVALNAKQRFRLVGVGLSNFRDLEDVAAQPTLFS